MAATHAPLNPWIAAAFAAAIAAAAPAASDSAIVADRTMRWAREVDEARIAIERGDLELAMSRLHNALDLDGEVFAPSFCAASTLYLLADTNQRGHLYEAVDLRRVADTLANHALLSIGDPIGLRGTRGTMGEVFLHMEHLYAIRIAHLEQQGASAYRKLVASLCELARLRHLRRVSAEDLYVCAVSAIESAAGANHIDLVPVLLGAAREHVLLRLTPAPILDPDGCVDRPQPHVSAATRLVRRALAIVEQCDSVDSPWQLAAFEQVVYLCGLLHDDEAVVQAARRWLEVSEATGAGAPDVAADMHWRLAGRYEGAGDYRAAEEQHRHAIRVLEVAHGERALQVAAALYSLSSFHSRRGGMEAAREAVRRSVSIYEHAAREGSPGGGTGLTALAWRLDVLHGDTGEADLMYRKAIAVFEAAMPCEVGEFAMTLRMYAEMLDRSGRREDAEGVRERLGRLLAGQPEPASEPGDGAAAH
ncbi:MAG: tetratricopeptide repeat protein [Phycisphaerales bacterium]|nr:tetratricopeptide repeat protein [Phycisphaerales bacterium]